MLCYYMTERENMTLDTGHRNRDLENAIHGNNS